jgi:flagellar protein FliT
VLNYYQSIAHKSSEMLAAAQAGNWDLLCMKEEECAHLIAELKAIGSSIMDDDAEKRERIQLLKKILADDAQIRELTEPWLKQLESLLRGAGNAKKLNSTYA